MMHFQILDVEANEFWGETIGDIKCFPTKAKALEALRQVQRFERSHGGYILKLMRPDEFDSWFEWQDDRDEAVVLGYDYDRNS